VVFAVKDPNPLVCGGGMDRLKKAGIEVLNGVLAEQAQKQNEVFFKYIRAGLPFVTVKLAVSLDGKVAAGDGTSKWITGKESRRRVHLMRSWSDAVMVGIGTVLADGPLLTVREVEGKDPLRVIVDTKLRTPFDAGVIFQGTIFCALDSVDFSRIGEFERRGVEIWTFPGTNGRLPLRDVFKRLGGRQVTSVLCEGGPSLASSLFKERLADKLVYMVAPILLDKGKSAFDQIGITTMSEALRFRDISWQRLGEDFMFTGYPEYDSPPHSPSLTS
jgi:diaminohydroxyphosphoribosylaminopyrimidine deaminase/5-amino-6-(5-phosphoribosylamino)uracil reductase